MGRPMAERPHRQRLGRRGEDAAARELTRRGYAILDRNWRPTGSVRGELDLVARHGEDLVVVEVKARTGRAWGGPELAVGPVKQRRLSRLLDAYLAEHDDLGETNCRFDMVALVLDRTGHVATCEVYPAAFDYAD